MRLIVLKEKCGKHLWFMIRRKQDMETVNRAFITPKDDPKLISSTIGGVPPATEDLVW